MKGGEFGIRKSAISRERERSSFRFLICEVGSEGATGFGWPRAPVDGAGL